MSPTTVRLLLIVFLVLISARTVAAQSSIKVELTVFKDEVVLGEPIFCRVEVNNKTKAKLRVQHGRHWGYRAGPSFSSVWVSTTQKMGDREIFNPGFKKSWKSGYGPLIPVNGNAVEKQVILGSKNGSFVFQDPGKYWIWAGAAVLEAPQGAGDEDNSVRSVSVKSPSRPVDQRMLKKIRDRKDEYIELVQAPWHRVKMTEKIEERNKYFELLAKNHRESAYAPYIIFSIGRHHRAIAIELSNNIQGIEGQTEEGSSRIARLMQLHAKKALKFWRRAKKLFDRRRLKQFVASEIKTMKQTHLMR